MFKLNTETFITAERVNGHSVVHQTPWIELREKEGYIYMHCPKWSGIAVAVLPFKRTNTGIMFLGIHEARPNHGGEPWLASLTGAYDNRALTIEETAIKELREESGYICTEDELIPLGWVFGSKGSDGVDNLFAVEITDSTPIVEILGDGSAIEANARPEWVDEITAMNSRDMILITMIARYQFARKIPMD
jgi:8-oxo-dGTP pyrophosphatase MutT (NUDIX family)